MSDYKKKIVFYCLNQLNYYVYKNVSKFFNDPDYLIQPTGAEIDKMHLTFYRSKGINCKIWDPSMNLDELYEAVVTPHQVDNVFQFNKVKHIRLMYGLAKDEWNYSAENIKYDLILTYGDYSKQNLEPFTPCINVGNPKFDDWFNNEFDQQLSERIKKFLDKNKKTILYLPTYGNLSSIDFYKEKILALTDKYNLMVKVHTMTNLYEPERKKYFSQNNILLFDDSDDLITILKYSDVILSDNSGAIFDALLADKPIALLNIPPEKISTDRLTSQESLEQKIRPLFLQADPQDNLEEVIARSQNFYEPKRQELQKIKNEIFTYRDGKCGERAYEAIKNLLAGEIFSKIVHQKRIKKLIEEKNQSISELLEAKKYFMGEIKEKNLIIQKQDSVSQEKEIFIQGLLNSTSWKITKPLRWASDKIKDLIFRPNLVFFIKKFIPRKLRPGLKKIYNRLMRGQIFIPTVKTKIQKWPSEKPLLSVIIPCFNYGQYLEEAIDSVLASTFQNFEIIVVDDGSTDLATIEILKNLNKPKTKIIHQKNQGLATARNSGIKIAQGKYILPLDADDTIEPTYIEKCLEILESQPEIGFVYSWVQKFGDDNTIWRTEEFDLNKLLRYNHISVSSIFRHEGWEAVGGYNPNMKFGYEDWDFWLSLAEAGWRGRLIKESLFLHRRHGKTMTHDAKEKYDYLIKQLQENHKELFTTAKVQQIIKNYKNYLVENYPLNATEPNQYLISPQKKVLCLLPWLQVGGGQAVVYEIINGLKNDFDFSIMTTLESQNEWHDKFYSLTKKIYHLPNFLNQNRRENYLPNFVRKHQIDTIFISGSEFIYSVLDKVKTINPQVRIVTLLHNDSKWGQADLDAKYDQYIDIHIGVNEKIKKLLTENYKIRENKAQVIYNAIDAENKFNPDNYQGNKILNELKLPKNKKIIAWIGRLSEEKRPLDFLKLAEAMKEQNDYFFAMIGEGPLEKEVARKGKKLSNFKLNKYTDKIPELLKNTYALVLTSEIEGLPMIILEAGAMSVPVISTDAGKVNRIIADGQNGYLVPVGDIEAIKEKINALDKLLPKQKIRQIIADNFSLEEMTKKYLEIL